jgi:hypothetical protein
MFVSKISIKIIFMFLELNNFNNEDNYLNN